MEEVFFFFFDLIYLTNHQRYEGEYQHAAHDEMPIDKEKFFCRRP